MEETRIRNCPSCGAAMECKLQNFSIGADGGGGLLTLLADQYEVDLYACPACGKVELYTAAFSPEPEPATYWCEHCQEEREDRLCPVCGQVGLLMEEHLRNLERAEQTQSSSAAQEDGVQPEESSGFHFPWQKKKVPWEK